MKVQSNCAFFGGDYMNILLLHGWNNDNYTSKTKSIDAWDNRKKFVKELKKNNKVYKLNFPGFCGESEPDRIWTLDDYAEFVNNFIVNNKLKIDYIIGYSFGGAVAIKYNRLYNNKQKLILISPAIIRNTKTSIKMFKTPKFLTKLRESIRDWYLIHIVKNKYMIDGTKFLRGSYQNIVRVELLDDIKKIKDYKIIYGLKDTMVNPSLVIDSLGNSNIYTIEDGGHDIANTHTSIVIKIISDIMKVGD